MYWLSDIIVSIGLLRIKYKGTRRYGIQVVGTFEGDFIFSNNENNKVINVIEVIIVSLLND